MTDPANPPVVETPVVAAEAAPTGAPETAAPVVETGAAPPVEPVVEAAPVVVAEPAKDPLVSETPSLLEETKATSDSKPAETPAAVAKPDDKPAEAPKVEAKPEDKKPDEAAKPVEPVAPEPIKYEFKLPEVIQDAPKEMGVFTTLLGEARVPAETGQKLLDLHAEAMTNYAKAYQEQALADQHKTFNDMRSAWRQQIKSDSELGGAGYETTSRAVARMRDLFVPEGDRKGFDEFLRVTGAGDHPALWRMLHRAARYFDEPAPPPPGAKPTKTNGTRPGANVLYDNPRSNVTNGQQ